MMTLDEKFSIVEDEVCKYYDISREVLLAKTRIQSIIEARDVLYYVMYRAMGVTKIEIARKYNYHHTAILHNLSKTEAYLKSDKEYRKAINFVTSKVLQRL